VAIRIRTGQNVPQDTANRVAIFDPVTGFLNDSVVTVDELALLSGLSGDILTTTNAKTVSNKTFAQVLVPDASNTRDIGSSGTKWKDGYFAGAMNVGSLATVGDAVVGGNLTVNGTTTTLNTATLDVEDTNLTINKGGNDASSEGAGLTVERTGTSGSFIYAAASATKWRVGPSGSEVDVVGASSTQALTNKTIVAASNTITTAASGNLAATEINAALAELQTDIDGRQASDSDLTAIAGLSSTGLIARTGSGTAAVRTLTGPAAGITVSNGDGVSGNPTLALANDLSSLEAMSGTGLVARTASETYAQRTITAGSSKLSVSNGDGISGNPTLDVVPGNISHATLANLSADDHTQYALLAGRSGGQTLIGGTAASNTLVLQSTSNGTVGAVVVGNQTGEKTRIGATGSTTTYSNPVEILTANTNSLSNGVVIHDNSADWPSNPATLSSSSQGFMILPKDNGGSCTILVRGANNQSFIKHYNASDGTNTGYFSMGLPWGVANANAGIITFKVSGTSGQAVDIQQWSNQSDFGNPVSAIAKDGHFKSPAGSASVAGYGLFGTAGIGMYFPSTSTVAWSIGSAQKMLLSATSLTLPMYSTGIAHMDSSGVITSTAVDVSGADITGTIADTNLPSPVATAISASDIDWATNVKKGGVYTKTLGANTTFTFSNKVAGQTIIVRLTNTASNWTVTWPTVKWAGGAAPTMTTGAKTDVYTFFYDGTDVFGNAVQNMS
jgi:hypothetical protein